jgi:group I intron endonuclease
MKKPIIGIYKITNLINQKGYVGKASNVYNRWKYHRYIAQKVKEGNAPKRGVGVIHYAIAKYGIDNFKFEILYSFTMPNISDSMLSSFEIFFIADQNTFIDDGHGYNLTKGGEGIHPAKQVRDKMSQSSSKERNGFYHKKHKSETIEMNRQAHLGKNRLPPEHIIQMSKKYLGEGNPFFQSTHNDKFLRSRSKPVFCIETGEFFKSSGYAGFHTHQLAASVYQAARLGTRAGGYHWKFITWEEYDKLSIQFPLFNLPIAYLNSRRN